MIGELKHFQMDGNDEEGNFKRFRCTCSIPFVSNKGNIEASETRVDHQNCEKLYLKKNFFYIGNGNEDSQNMVECAKFLSSRKKVECFIKNSQKNFYFQKFGNCIGESRGTVKFLNELSGKQKRIPIVPALSSILWATLKKDFDVALKMSSSI